MGKNFSKLSSWAVTILIIMSVFSEIPNGSAAPAREDVSVGCSNTGDANYVRCLNDYLEILQNELTRAYEKVLLKIPEKDDFDTRKSREQLEKSQSSWITYTKENCTFIGGLRGGGSMSVTGYSIQCLIKETSSRIVFFENLPHGG